MSKQDNKEKEPAFRLFNIMQYEKNPKTGEDLNFNEGNIKNALRYKTIKRYGYILHDKDTYNDEEAREGEGKLGDLKGKHWHAVIECNPALPISTISRWFGVPAQYIDIPKGQGAFLDCIQYLTHENEEGKHIYSDEEVKANFDFRKELKEREENRLKYGRDLDKKERQRFDVLYCGKTLRQCIADDKYLYMQDMEKLKKLRMEFIYNQDPPTTRINYYVCGKGGYGKDLLCKVLAKSLFRQYDKEDDIYFIVGSKGSLFEGYDGQPVIIWSDKRAVDLLQELGGRGNVFNILDPHPTRARQNIKYSSINLCNVVNIINSVEPYTDFLDGLAGEYVDQKGNLHNAEDKAQSYRRFPIILPIHTQDIDVLVNKGFLDNTTEFLQYTQYMRISGNMRQIAEDIKNKQLREEIEAQTVQVIVDKHNEIIERDNKQELTEEEIRAKFKNYGKPVIIDEPKEEPKEAQGDGDIIKGLSKAWNEPEEEVRKFLNKEPEKIDLVKMADNELYYTEDFY